MIYAGSKIVEQRAPLKRRIVQILKVLVGGQNKIRGEIKNKLNSENSSYNPVKNIYIYM
jgi:hypothetical protein